MAILLWWSLASICVSLFLGAFLSFGHRDPERERQLDLDGDRHRAAPSDPVTTRANLT